MRDISKDTHTITFFTGYPRVNRLETITSTGFTLSCVVLPSAKKYLDGLDELRTYCQDNGIRVEIVPNLDTTAIDDIANNNNMLISSGYPRLIPKSLYSRFYCAVNFHPSLLPRNRGRYLHYILINQEQESGCTLHLIDDGIDTGPILLQKQFPVSPFDTIHSLQRKSDQLELGMLTTFLDDPRAVLDSARIQDESLATSYIEKRTATDSELDDSMSLKEAFFTLRALDADLYPGYIEIEGEKVAFSIRRITKPSGEEDMV